MRGTGRAQAFAATAVMHDERYIDRRGLRGIDALPMQLRAIVAPVQSACQPVGTGGATGIAYSRSR